MATKEKVIVYRELNLRLTLRIPITVIPDSPNPPVLLGERGHYETPAGSRVRSGKAYSKKGKCRYIASTERIEVGQLWLNNRYKSSKETIYHGES